MLDIAAIVLRVFLLLFGAIVLGLSITLAKHQQAGSVPTETSFSSFVGGFGLVVSVIGLVALWVHKIPTIFVIGADALATVFYLAGGIALTLALKDASNCTSNDAWAVYNRANNKLLTGGCIDIDGGEYCYYGDKSSETVGRCQRVQADYVFEYAAFLFGVGVIALGWVIHRRGGTTRASYV